MCRRYQTQPKPHETTQRGTGFAFGSHVPLPVHEHCIACFKPYILPTDQESKSLVVQRAGTYVLLPASLRGKRRAGVAVALDTGYSGAAHRSGTYPSHYRPISIAQQYLRSRHVDFKLLIEAARVAHAACPRRPTNARARSHRPFLVRQAFEFVAV
ncbi:uncharacterized protein TrAFT101_005064 [Trichoderma asperellum]|uniref:uncharacterized protein n=1 Tax=Trichoderma asperellum TaxID=101201 RepID=UPI00331A3C57|nr:hypothetical protein TrAFT101_005064 [Trichoderma asperellum]